MREWSVYIEAWAPEGKPGSIDISDSRVSDFAEMLAPFGAATSVDRFRWAVQITISAETALDAAQSGSATAIVAASQCRFPEWSIERLEVVDADRRDADLAVSNFPDLVGTKEASEMLDLTRQRIHALRQEGRFPEPMVELGAGPIWLRSAIESFDLKERKPGRPSNEAKWTKALVDDYFAILEKLRTEPQSQGMWGHERDLVVHQLVGRHGVDVASRVLGVPIEDVEAAMARPGIS